MDAAYRFCHHRGVVVLPAMVCANHTPARAPTGSQKLGVALEFGIFGIKKIWFLAKIFTDEKILVTKFILGENWLGTMRLGKFWSLSVSVN